MPKSVLLLQRLIAVAMVAIIAPGHAHADRFYSIFCTSCKIQDQPWGNKVVIICIAESSNHKRCTLDTGSVHAGLLAKPFVLCISNEAAAADALNQLLTVCLRGKQNHLPSLLADIIAAVTTATAEANIAANTNREACSASDREELPETRATAASAAAAAAAIDAGAASEGLCEGPVQATAAAAASQAASEAAISMLAAVADKLSPEADGRVQSAGRKQLHARFKEAKLDLTHQQESAGHVLLAYASKGPEEQKMVLGLYFRKVRVLH